MHNRSFYEIIIIHYNAAIIKSEQNMQSTILIVSVKEIIYFCVMWKKGLIFNGSLYFMYYV